MAVSVQTTPQTGHFAIFIRRSLVFTGISVIAFALLTQTPQTLELYKILVIEAQDHLLQLALAVLFLVLASLMAIVAARATAVLNKQRGAFQLAASLSGYILPVSIIWGIAECLFDKSLAVDKSDFQNLPQLAALIEEWQGFQGPLYIALAVSVGITLAIAALDIFVIRWWCKTHAVNMRGLPWTAAFFALTAVSILLFAVSRIDLPQRIGAPALFFLFLFLLYYWIFRLSQGVLIALVVIILVLSLLNLDAPSAIKLIDRKPGEIKFTHSSFADWYKQRKDVGDYLAANKPYPVFVVAASGGGIYAALHTALVLSRIQDHCPSFAQHIFAVSSVSGGSVGASVFAGLASLRAKNDVAKPCVLVAKDHTLEELARKTFRQDYLSPILASALFPEFFQRVVPLSLIPHATGFERAASFESALNKAWNTIVADTNFFKTPFLDLWREDGVAPALFLNATDVNRGARVVFAPFITDFFGDTSAAEISASHDFYASYGFFSQYKSNDLETGTVTTLSGRFPWLFPAGVLPYQEQRLRLVDGGYFDNSGVDALANTINVLKENEGKPTVIDGSTLPPVDVHLIIINGHSDYTRRWTGFDEVLDPIRALLNARERHGDRAVYSISNLGLLKPEKIHDYLRNERDFDLPLAWQISDFSARVIALHSGEPDPNAYIAADVYGVTDKKTRIIDFVYLSEKSTCEIMKLLKVSETDGEVCAPPMQASGTTPVPAAPSSTQ